MAGPKGPVANFRNRHKNGGIGVFLDFINHLKSKAPCKHAVLLWDSPITGKVEPFAQPEHRLEPLYGSASGIEGLKAATLCHVLFHPEMIVFNPLLQDFRHVVSWSLRQEHLISHRRDG
jgi:hypothetical protein